MSESNEIEDEIVQTRLHLDADVSARALFKALLARGYDVTRTPCEWMERDATDEKQLLGATAQGRVILTYNIKDFVTLAQQYPKHGGIILANQRQWTLSMLISALDKLLTTTTNEDWLGQIRWLNEWYDANE